MGKLGSIGENGASEFFETILYQTAYSEAQEQIKDFTKDIDNEIIQDALQGSMTVISSGLVFMLMRQQENFIEKIFEISGGLVMLLLGSSAMSNIKGKFSKLKGVKLLRKLDIFGNKRSEKIATAQLVVTGTGNHFLAESTTQNETSLMDSVAKSKQEMMTKEKLHLDLGSSMASRYNETLLFKLFTKSFTAKDETLIKKMIGRDTASTLDIEDMNKVADFMFVTDTDGNVTGLTEQLIQLINGLGYLHK